jgi:hypothetical protein
MIGQFVKFVSVLASRQESFRVWGRFDHGKPASATDHLWIIICALTLCAAAALVWQRLSRRGEREFSSNSPARLFDDLCRAHKLSRASRRCLKQLAVDRNIDPPATLFLEPEHLDSTDVPPRLKSSIQELRQLRAKLFG